METFAGICEALDTGADELLWGVPGPSDAVLDMWNLPDKKNGSNKNGKKTRADAGKEPDNGRADSYAMYVRIMKSVAEIMNEN